jgi:hypothetical protein
MQARTSRWYNNSVAIERGPLVYSLKIGESWHKIKQTGPAADWEVYPTTPWNYALVLNPGEETKAIEVIERPIGKQPFSQDGAPVELKLKAQRLPAWQVVDDSAGPMPISPVTSRQAEQVITLIPYGAAKLRVTAFPYALPGVQSK